MNTHIQLQLQLPLASASQTDHPAIHPSSHPLQERLARRGPSALSDAELLAIILRNGAGGESALDTATRLLSRYGSLAGLVRANISELAAERGIGVAKAAQLQAALELGRRMTLAVAEERTAIYNPSDAAALLMAEIGHLEQEHFCVLFLNTRYRILGIQTIYKGSVTLIQIRVGEVFREAVRRNCASIIVAHNHPSGDPTPSPEDIAITRKLEEAGRILGIEVLDHLIIGQQRWTSMRDLIR